MPRFKLISLFLLGFLLFFGGCGQPKNDPASFQIEEKGGYKVLTKYTGSDKTVVIPQDVAFIGSSAFADCDSLESVVIPKGVMVISGYAFMNCGKLKSVRIPGTVTRIGDGAFVACSSLKSLTIPKSVTDIAPDAFTGCESLKKWKIPKDHSEFKTSGDCLLSKDGKTLIMCPAASGDYRIPEGVTEIGEFAFSFCTSLTSVVIPKGVTKIGENAFSGCESLKSVVIPEGVMRIDHFAFLNCSSLESVVIPEGVKVIGSSSFEGCVSLNSITIPESMVKIGYQALQNCPKLTIRAPKGSEAERLAFTFDIPFEVYPKSEEAPVPPAETPAEEPPVLASAVKSYDPASFGILRMKGKTVLSKYLGSDANVVIPEGVEAIGSKAFFGCGFVKSVTIPETVTEIGPWAFAGCGALESVNIPPGVTKIEAGTFSGCKSLKNLEIPETVTEIGADAFKDCPSQKIRMPKEGTAAAIDVGNVEIVQPQEAELDVSGPIELPELPNQGKPGAKFQLSDDKEVFILPGQNTLKPQEKPGNASPYEDPAGNLSPIQTLQPQKPEGTIEVPVDLLTP
ncbi:MAG: leucine-rich repeat domain-containing protein [Thermoguttaceae bacterium]|nr:leucine-rich repeat domain-containing protein [Thermoguttaceae bacterium]